MAMSRRRSSPRSAAPMPPVVTRSSPSLKIEPQSAQTFLPATPSVAGNCVSLFPMKIRFLLSLLLVFVVGCAPSNAQTVAVFDPQSGPLQGRFVIDPAALDQTAQTLTNAGFTVSRVTAEQLANPGQFSAAKFDVYVSRGDSMRVMLLITSRNFLTMAAFWWRWRPIVRSISPSPKRATAVGRMRPKIRLF